MSKKPSINYQVKVNTIKFRKDINKLKGWRIRLAELLIRVAEKIIGKRIKIDYEITAVK